MSPTRLTEASLHAARSGTVLPNYNRDATRFGIVHIGPVMSVQKAGGKWNTYEITVKGPKITLVLNGVRTAEASDTKLQSGPFGLQFGNRGKEPGGAIKFRKVQIKTL